MSAEHDIERAGEFRTVPAVFGSKKVQNDPAWEWDYAAHLKQAHSPAELLALYSRYRSEEGAFETQLRRIIFRAMCRNAGHALQIAPEVVLKHAETMEIGDAVFIGAQTMIQGRFDGKCRIGNHVWIGPHAYFDARDLVLEDYVGWGPGAKVLGSSHTGNPTDVPIIATELLMQARFHGHRLRRRHWHQRDNPSRSACRSAFHRGRWRGRYQRCPGILGRRGCA